MSAWKPGDVARIDYDDGSWDRALRTSHDDWSVPGGVHPGTRDARPLVVIDPEDAEAVERLADAWRAQTHATLGDAAMTLDAYRLQAALREFANPTPPKPEEPQGLGAVVRDAAGKTWVRVGRCSDWYQAHGKWAQYHSIDAVEVLSEGVIA